MQKKTMSPDKNCDNLFIQHDEPESPITVSIDGLSSKTLVPRRMLGVGLSGKEFSKLIDFKNKSKDPSCLVKFTKDDFKNGFVKIELVL